MSGSTYRLFCFVAIILILLAMATVTADYAITVSKVKPYVPIKQQVLDYPYRDGSDTLSAAEKRVEKRIDKVIQRWNSTCAPAYRTCGAVERRSNYVDERANYPRANKSKFR